MQTKNEVLIIYNKMMSMFSFYKLKLNTRLLETKVRNMMKEKQDYKAWYYVPVPKEPMEMKQEYIENVGRHGYDVKYPTNK
jgi:hypothetical protein